MITERVIEVRVQVICDACRRNRGVVRKQLNSWEKPEDVMRGAESELEAEDSLTGQRWLSRKGLHICPPCAKSVQATAAVLP